MSLRLKKVFQIIIPSFVFGALFFFGGYFKSYHLPKIKSWLLLELEEVTRENTPFSFWPRKVELHLFPPSIEFSNIRALPLDQLKGVVAPTTIDKIYAEIGIINLLSGKLKLSNLTISQIDLGIFLSPESIEALQNKFKNKKDTKSNLHDFNKILAKIPIDQLDIKGLNLGIKNTDKNFAAKVSQIDLTAKIENSELVSLELETPLVMAKKLGEEPILHFSFGTKIFLTENQLTLAALKIKKDESFVVSSGEVTGHLMSGRWDKYNFNTRSSVQLSALQTALLEFFPNQYIPKMKGHFFGEVRIEQALRKKPNIDFNIATKNAFVDGFEVGQLAAEGKITESATDIVKANINHSSGRLNIENARFEFGNKVTFEANLGVKHLEINQLLKSLKLGDIPIHLPLEGDLPCYGEISPKLKISCQGIVDVKDLQVWDSSEREFEIVSINPAQVIGGVEVTDSQVSYDTKLKVGKSRGWSKGVVSFEKGFDISYGGLVKNLKTDLRNLANLDLEGRAKIKGRTWGDSNYGRIFMDIQSQQLWLEDFGLGDSNFELNYKKGILNFRKILSAANSSRFKGHVSVNLRKNTIYGKIESPFWEASDAQELLSRKVQLPFRLGGTGAAAAEFDGPLNFSLMSYDFDLSLFRGTAGQETFDKLRFHVASKNGFVESKQVFLAKADSRIDMKGQVDPEGKVDVVVLGDRLRLEQSETLNNLGLNLGGKLDFTMAMKGPILSPDTELHGRLSRTLLGNRQEQDSTFWLRFNRDSLEGKGQFLGNVVSTDFDIPYDSKGPLKFKLNTKDWNFTHLFNLFSGASSQKSYETRLTSAVDLLSPKNSIWGATGRIEVTDFFVKRGEAYLQNQVPFYITFNKGVIKSENFEVEGPSSFFKVDIKDSKRENINVAMNGKFELGLLSLLTPFLDEIQGTGSLSLKLTGPALAPDTLGSAYVQDTSLKLKGLPHPFQKLTADILFSQKNIVINALKSNFANGVLTADGKITFVSPQEIPINIKGRIQKVTLMIPEGFESYGSGEIYLRGKTSPYTLGGQFNIEKGQVKTNLAGGVNNEQKIQPSEYLPKFLAKESFDPIKFNLAIDLLSPISVNAVVPEAEINTSIDGNITLKGSPSLPILKGVIRAEPNGQMLFRSNKFDIASAVIEYNDNIPQEPDLFVSAKANIRSRDQSLDGEDVGDDYEVTLDIQGSAKDPSITLTSQPQLSESDIVSLLAFGVTTSNYSQVDSDQQAIQSGVEVGAQFVKQKLGLDKAVESTTGLQLNLSSTMDDENTAAPKITIKKQFTPKFGMSYSRTEGKSPADEMKVEYKFSQKLSVVGQVERQEAGTTTDSDVESKNQEKVGIDLEYKFQFK